MANVYSSSGPQAVTLGASEEIYDRLKMSTRMELESRWEARKSMGAVISVVLMNLGAMCSSRGRGGL